MKIKDIALSAAAIGERVVKAIAIGAVEVWSAVKYIIFKDPVVEQICVANWGDGVGITEEQAAAVTSIRRVFQGNTEITSFDELKYFGVNEINQDGFKGCTSLRSIDFSNIESIGGYAFYNCSNLIVRFDYPKMKTLGVDSFYTCTVHIVNMEGVETYSGAFRGNKVTGIVNAPNIKGTVGSFAESLITQVLSLGMATGLGSQAFARCKYLEKLILPPTLKSIGRQAFQDAPLANTENNIPEIISNVTETGYEALVRCGVYIEDLRLDSLETMAGCSFEGCDIRKVSNTGKVSSIGNRSFYSNPNLIEANISEHVTQIGDYAFSQCRSLKTVILKSVVPPSIGTTTFSNTHADLSIYVPFKSLEAYKTATNWSAYASRIKPLSEYTE